MDGGTNQFPMNEIILRFDKMMHGRQKTEKKEMVLKDCVPILTELESEYSQAQSGLWDFKVNIPAGTSRRDAGRLVRRGFCKFWKGIQTEAQTESYDSDRKL